MKSKSILTILLLSLLLNIFHDFTIAHQINTDCSTKVEPLDSNKDCDKVDSLHNFFHFSAIVLGFKAL